MSPEELNPVQQKSNEGSQHPLLECDLVMKGGITSGVVYPPVLNKLKEKYTFNSIGGASAGAIAAAAAAAAEYGRKTKGDEPGRSFHRLSAVSQEFVDQDQKLLNLFRPPKTTSVIWHMMRALGRFGGPRTRIPIVLRLLSALFYSHPLRFLLGLLVGGLIGWFVVGYAAINTLNGIFEDQPFWPQAVVLLLTVLSAAGLTLAFGPDAGKRKRLASVLAWTFGASLILLFVPSALVAAFPGHRLDDPNPGLTVYFTVLLAITGAIVSVAFHMIRTSLFREIPKNFYGIVNGHDEVVEGPENRVNASRPTNPTHLTDWLCVMLDQIAGLDTEEAQTQARRQAAPAGKPTDRPPDSLPPKPLTFGDLREQDITLEMVTTNISLGIPYKLPFADDDILIFDEREVRQLFPDYIVNFMISRPPSPERVPADLREKLPKGPKGESYFHFLPDPEDLPVAVAARMSFAVPIFISAIPLYTLSAQAYRDYKNGSSASRPFLYDPGRKGGSGPNNDLLLNYFSDGGTTSNFPIHFFDYWLPPRPTFGVNLTSMPLGVLPSDDPLQQNGGSVQLDFLSAHIHSGPTNERDLPDVSGNATPPPVPPIVLPQIDEMPLYEWKPVANPFDFLAKVVQTAREHHDNSHSRLPGYRDRIVQIRLDSSEGGMNLAMDPATLQGIMVKGNSAGEALRCQFSFEDHKWVRFRVLMARLETEIQSLRETFGDERLGYKTLVSPGKSGDTQIYQRDADWRALALTRVENLLSVVDLWRSTMAAQANIAPQPAPEVPVDKASPTNDLLTHFSEFRIEPELALRVVPKL